MLTLTERLANTVPASDTLTLPYASRIRSRLRVRLDSGREAALQLERGLVLHSGDRLAGPDGTVIEVRAAIERVSTAHTDDRLLLARLHTAAAADDLDRFARLADEALAWRESAELRAEERHKGRALGAVLDGLEPGLDPAWRHAAGSGYLAGFAWACARWAVPVTQAAEGYAYGWLENQVIAAVKLVPLGQAAGQRVLHRLATRLPALVDGALACDDGALGASATTLAIASACHESQYTRLYRS